MSKEEAPFVIFYNVTKWYKGNVIGLNQFTAQVSGGITGLVGPNGAGKSTFLKLATGQIKPNIGIVRVFNKDPFRDSSVFNDLGYCPEQDAFWSWMTGKEFVEILAKAKGYSKEEAKKETTRVLKIVSLDDERADRPIITYSKGMRQRIKVAQALIGSPSLLLLDEPFAGADPITRAHLGRTFEDLRKEGVSIILSSHVLHEVEQFADQIKLIYRGRLLAEGPVRDIRALIYDHPHRIKILTDSPRELAKYFVSLPSVKSLEITDPSNLHYGILWILTHNPAVFYKELPKVLVSSKVHVEEIMSVDDNLQAVFEYLTQ